MVLFSFIFVGLFVFETIWLINRDHTGQGLVGMMLLIPFFLICLTGLFSLLSSKIIREFRNVTKQ